MFNEPQDEPPPPSAPETFGVCVRDWNGEATAHEVSLRNTGQKDKQTRPIWSASGIAVPYQSSVQFKIHYWLRGTRYKDDNSSRYYLAPEPPAETVPPPPKELGEAALAWKL